MNESAYPLYHSEGLEGGNDSKDEEGEGKSATSSDESSNDDPIGDLKGLHPTKKLNKVKLDSHKKLTLIRNTL